MGLPVGNVFFRENRASTAFMGMSEKWCFRTYNTSMQPANTLNHSLYFGLGRDHSVRYRSVADYLTVRSCVGVIRMLPASSKLMESTHTTRSPKRHHKKLGVDFWC
jgi:hypothetical protein